MKYFITSDVHGFYSILKKELDKKGFDINNSEHILLICGDTFDRGKEAKELLDFLLNLKEQNRLILVKGNHEWLLEDCVEELKAKQEVPLHHFSLFSHVSNKTLNTISQLTGITELELMGQLYEFKDVYIGLKKYYELVKDVLNYYEVGDNIFVHGWIPHIRDYQELKNTSDEEWERASWLCGVDEFYNGWKLEGKTIWCGHWHTSHAWFKYKNIGSGEFEKDSCFDTYKDNEIVCLDACTASTGKINIEVLEV